MTQKNVTSNKANIVLAGLVFVAAIMVGELTFGNPKFMVTVWYFPDTPAWQWSVPVHTVGFFWMLLCARFFRNRPLAWPVAFSTLFFFIGEALNWCVLNIFAYGGQSLGVRLAAFGVVILMYLLLCTVTLWVLRHGVRQTASDKTKSHE